MNMSAPGMEPFAQPTLEPTQQGALGITYDFCHGARVHLPSVGMGTWVVRFADLDTGNIVFQSAPVIDGQPITEGVFGTKRHYFARWRIDAFLDGQPVFRHDFDARGKEVLIQAPPGGRIGDTIAFMKAIAAYADKHRCHLTVGMHEKLIPLFAAAYPDICFRPHADIDTSRFYANYMLGIFFDDPERAWCPIDHHLTGLAKIAAYILGVSPSEERPLIAIDHDQPRPIDERYVCISVQSTAQCKFWNNPTGWIETVRYLNDQGYRVICIDESRLQGAGFVWNHIPPGAEDETGPRPLQERANWLKHADFFVGLSSGLAWLAWAVGTPAVVISGFTHPQTEFPNPYRVHNTHVCNSCWNDPAEKFDHMDPLWCPRHKGTLRQFECSTQIMPEQVRLVIERLMKAEPGRIATESPVAGSSPRRPSAA